MLTRRRLDQLLVDRGLADSRSRARALIEAGLVQVAGASETKPGRMLRPDEAVVLSGLDHPWVSRGGLKLAAAFDRFAIVPEDVVAIDVGASTGGFTDVLLARGARRVYAVDVGSGQLAPKLRADARVISLEGVNARMLTADEVPEPADMIVCDASFIGLEAILPAPMALAAPGAVLVALIKPQFEVGPENVGKGGIVRDPALHDSVCRRIENWLVAQPGWRVVGLIESPITGGDGNREFLICARRAR
ncbi:MAG TPA: TlyA family RNA methyltransferase [Stellaceae bacterium]|nr:TlyA family RNA methyltransferase [Stellaceae bacterium]